MARILVATIERARVLRMSRTGGRVLFGEVALRNEWVTAESLYVALTIQKHGELAGREVPRIGVILVHMGAMTPDRVSNVLEELTRQ